MLREDFKRHPIWATLGAVDEQLDAIRDGQPSIQDLPAIDRIEVMSARIRRWYIQRDRLAPYFNPQMLTPVDSAWQDILRRLNTRVQYGETYASETEMAAQAAEDALLHLAPWPALLPTAKESESEQTIFEDLLESQRKALATLDLKHAELLSKIEQIESGFEARASEVEASLATYEAGATRIEAAVTAQAARIDDALERATHRIGELNQQNDASFEAWVVEKADEFDSRLAPYESTIVDRLERAERSLEALRATEAEFANLSSASAADKLAGHFQAEARVSRHYGFLAYIAAVVIAGVGVVPLIIFIVETGRAEVPADWPSVVLRLSISFVSASAAAVFVNLGSRFFTQATSSKRTELELRTINPLLANVEARDQVDSALINLVDRSFGLAPSVERSSEGDGVALPKSAIIEVIMSALKREG